jgi:hypothetical protein
MPAPSTVSPTISGRREFSLKLKRLSKFSTLLRRAGGWIASSALRDELERNPDEAKRAVSLALLDFASEVVEPSEATLQRASVLVADGFGSFDALHLALAEE